MNKNRWLLVAAAGLMIVLSRLPVAPAEAPANTPAAKPVAKPAAAPLTFEQSCFLNWQTSEGLSQVQAKQFFEPVAGQPCQWSDGPNVGNRIAVTLTGLVRLRAPWSDDTVLRITLYPSQSAKLCFWSQQGGVVLSCCRVPQYPHKFYWTATRTSRRPGTPPASPQLPSAEDTGTALLATDDQRADRSMAGDYAVRYQAGTLVLTKGDLRILTVPLETAPREVFLEGQGIILRQLAMEHGPPAPDDPIAPPKTILQCDQPARLPWAARTMGNGSFQRLDDGSVELAAKETTKTATTISMPLFRPGLYEVIFQLDAPSPESGVFLADDSGEAVQGVEFYRVNPQSPVAYRFNKPAGLSPITLPTPPPDFPQIAFAPRQPWLRLVLGGGVVKCFASADGVHWGQSLATLPQGGNFTRIGLFCQPGNQPRRIALRRLAVRQLDALMALAPIELEERAEASAVTQAKEELSDLIAWQLQAMGGAPAGVDGAQWRRACALATLVHGPEPPLAKALLEKLLEDGLSRPLPLPDKLRLLHQVSLLWDPYTNEETQRLAAHWERLAATLLREGTLQDLDEYRKGLMTASFWTQNQRVEPLSEAVARSCLMSLVCRNQWNQADWLCGQLRFWHQSADPGGSWSGTQGQVAALINWIKPLSDGPGKPNPTTGARADVLMQHLITVQSNKDAFNLVSDLRNAVDDKDYRQAFRLVTSATLTSELSLIPDGKDPRRFESLTTTIRRLVESNPPLKQAMNQSLTAMDNLRVSRTMAQGDVAKVRNLSIQYYGTPAGADALRWLGDRLLGAGEFARAISCFEQALPMASAAQEPQVAARLRLAGAMLGRRLGQPTTGPVQFGDMEMPAADFEKLLTEMLQEHAKGRTIAGKPVSEGQTPATAPGPGLRILQPREAIEGDWGTSPQNVPNPSNQLDWSARQLAVSFEGDWMLVANRFQIAALDPKSGAQRWAYRLGPTQGPTHAWPLVPMRPTVAADRLYARMINQDGRPGLVCLELPSGKMLWNVRYPGEIVCDPLAIQGVLMALSIENDPDPTVNILYLLTLDPENGKVVGRRPLVDISGEWTTQRACQVAVAQNKLLMAVAGALICCDPFDEVLWVRRGSRLPPNFDSTYWRQYHQPPLVEGQRAYVCQVGSRSVECVGLQSGQLHWERAMPNLLRVLGLAGERLLVETEEGILALSTQDGKPVWSHPVQNLLDVYPRAGSNTLVCLRTEPYFAGQRWAVLEWIDLQTGQTAGRCPLGGLKDNPAIGGPLVADGQRLWCFAAANDPQNPAKRRLVELVAAEGRLPASAATNLWTAPVDPGWTLALERALPGWTLISGTYDAKSGLLSPLPGMPEVLVTRAETPVRLARQLSVPANKPQLVIEMGHAPEGTSRFEVQVDGVVCQQWRSQPMKNTNDWQKIQVDLSAAAGRNALVLITQERIGGGVSYAYWKTIELKDAAGSVATSLEKRP